MSEGAVIAKHNNNGKIVCFASITNCTNTDTLFLQFVIRTVAVLYIVIGCNTCQRVVTHVEEQCSSGLEKGLAAR